MAYQRNILAHETSAKNSRPAARTRACLTNMLGVFLLCTALVAGYAARVLAADHEAIPQSAVKQIQALMAEKSTRTPAQKKISSRLLYANKMRRGESVAQGVATLRNSVKMRRDNTILVDIRANVSEAALAQLEGAGATIIHASPKYGAIRARVRLDQLETMATMADIRFIKPADRMTTNSHAFSAVNVSQGDVAHRADAARDTFSIDGTGVTIGVLSDGVDSLADRQASGDLPATVTILPGQAGGGDEGTAMLEIVHDLAPGANLMFATAFNGQASFAENIEALRAAGADVIVDDIFYFAEPTFQDGIIAQAVDTVAADGGLYFSSAGNSGNLNDGTSGTWEGDFAATAAPAILGDGVVAHDFGSGDNSNEITADSPSLFTLSWADAQGASANDYDLYLLSPDLMTVWEASTNIQDGTQNPFEAIDSEGFDDTGNRLVIVKFSGEDRFLHLDTHRGELAVATQGQTSGHAAATGAFGVAAVDVATANGGAFTGGPDNPVELFSSDGPRRIFYHANGTPMTPGDFSATGGAVRQKPDLAAADGVATSTPGFGTFFGTSAAAPHAAAIAGLLLEADASLSVADARDILTSTALDIEAPGVDRDSGYGIVDAFAAVQAATAGDPQLVAPSTNRKLLDSTQLFKWDGQGTNVHDWWLYVGTAANTSDIYNSGPLTPDTLSASVTGIPLEGGTIHVRLWYRTDTWHFVDTQYTAELVPELIAPAPSSLLNTTSVTFRGQTTSNDLQHWMWIGTQQGTINILNKNMNQSNQLEVHNLPAYGQIYVRYWTRFVTGWKFRDHTYFIAAQND